MAKSKTKKKKAKTAQKKSAKKRVETTLVETTQMVDSTPMVAEPEKDITFTDGPKLHEMDLADISADMAKDLISDTPPEVREEPEVTVDDDDEPDVEVDVEPDDEPDDSAYAREIWNKLSEEDRQEVLKDLSDDDRQSLIADTQTEQSTTDSSQEPPDEVPAEDTPKVEVPPAIELAEVETAMTKMRSAGIDEVADLFGPIITKLVERDIARQKVVDALSQSDEQTQEGRRVSKLQGRFDEALDAFSDSAMPTKAQQLLVLKITKGQKNPDYKAEFKEVMLAVTGKATPKPDGKTDKRKTASAMSGGGSGGDEPSGLTGIDGEGYTKALKDGDPLVSALVTSD